MRSLHFLHDLRRVESGRMDGRYSIRRNGRVDCRGYRCRRMERRRFRYYLRKFEERWTIGYKVVQDEIQEIYCILEFLATTLIS